jgi:hypothetical protein
MRGAIPPLPQYASMAWCLVKHRGFYILRAWIMFWLWRVVVSHQLLLIQMETTFEISELFSVSDDTSKDDSKVTISGRRPGGVSQQHWNWSFRRYFSNTSGIHPSFSPSWVPFPQVRRPNIEVESLPPSSTEVKNVWSFTSLTRNAFMAWLLATDEINMKADYATVTYSVLCVRIET